MYWSVSFPVIVITLHKRNSQTFRPYPPILYFSIFTCLTNMGVCVFGCCCVAFFFKIFFLISFRKIVWLRNQERNSWVRYTRRWWMDITIEQVAHLFAPFSGIFCLHKKISVGWITCKKKLLKNNRWLIHILFAALNKQTKHNKTQKG
jgi:hypothetical protein